MNFKSFQQRRDFLKTASALAVAGGVPALDTLANVALAAAPSGTTQVDAGYKAIVCVFLYGGQDHANVLIPYRDSNGTGTTEYTRYRTGRANGTDPQDQSLTTGDLSYSNAQLAATALNVTAGTTDPGINAVFTNHTYGRRFALHPSYTELASLYNSGKLAVISNVGPLISPINRDQWYTGTGGPRPLNLYSHDDQQKAWMSGTANIANPERGIGGRIASHPAIAALNAGAQVATQISLDGTNTFMLADPAGPSTAIAYQIGSGSIGRIRNGTTNPVWATPGVVTCDTGSTFITNNPTSPYCVVGGPIKVSNGYTGNNTLYQALYNGATGRITTSPENVSIYHDQWRATMRQSIDTEAAIAAAFVNFPPTEDVVAPFQSIVGTGNTYNYLAAQLRMVAAMIRASVQLGAGGTPLKRQIFFVGIGGFDTHGTEFWDNNPKLNRRISQAINAFWTAMGTVQVTNGGVPTGANAQSAVTLLTMTDFGRTHDSNGQGSDHGWGSYHFVLGGAVRGGAIYGMNHNIQSGTTAAAGTVPAAGTSRYLGTDATTRADLTCGSVPRIGIPPDPYSGPTTAGARCNGLNHCLSRGELLATTSGDAVMATIAKWFGVPMTTNAEVDALFPTLRAAHPNTNWTATDMGFMNP
jgi:uncharacterized protein (DUF1501 family)